MRERNGNTHTQKHSFRIKQTWEKYMHTTKTKRNVDIVFSNSAFVNSHHGEMHALHISIYIHVYIYDGMHCLLPWSPPEKERTHIFATSAQNDAALLLYRLIQFNLSMKKSGKRHDQNKNSAWTFEYCQTLRVRRVIHMIASQPFTVSSFHLWIWVEPSMCRRFTCSFH